MRAHADDAHLLPLHKRTPLWECALNSTCMPHAHHAGTHTPIELFLLFFGLFVLFCTLHSQTLPPADATLSPKLALFLLRSAACCVSSLLPTLKKTTTCHMGCTVTVEGTLVFVCVVCVCMTSEELCFGKSWCQPSALWSFKRFEIRSSVVSFLSSCQC